MSISSNGGSMTPFPDPSDLIGGHPAVDFVNTVSWRLDAQRAVDRLPDFAALVGWALAAGLVTPVMAARLRRTARADPGAAARALRRARRLREQLHEVLATAAAGAAPDLSRLAPALADAVRHATPERALPLRWTVPVQAPEDLPRRLAIAGLDLLGDPALPAHLRCCEGAGCGWLFLDHSRSHTRRWCSSGDCGNRERVRRHYARTRPTG